MQEVSVNNEATESRLEGGGVNRRSLKISPANTYTKCETETPSRTMSDWVGLCTVIPDNVRSGVSGT
jgi:hypothetical protein